MGFVIGQIRTVKRIVKFEQPADDGKKPQKCDLVVEFKVHGRDVLKARRAEVQEYVRRINSELKKAREQADYELDIPEADNDESYLRADIVDIEGCLDASGNSLEFSAELLNAVLVDRSAFEAILEAWIDLNKLDGAKRKN